MSRDIYSKLERYERRGRELQQAADQVKHQQRTNQQKSNLFKEGAAELIKSQLGVNKRHSRPILNILEQEGNQRNQIISIEREFESWYSELKQFVGTISEETKSNRQNSQKLLRKFNRVERKVNLDTKLKHTIRVIQELRNLDLVYNDELNGQRQEATTKRRDAAAEPSSNKHPVADLSLEEILAKGETNAIEFKRSLPDSVRDIAAELVALATQKGGVLIIGVADDGTVIGVDDVNRIEERVVNVVRNSVEPPLNPDVEMRSIDGSDVLLLEVPQSRDPPHGVNGTFYTRVGTSKRKLTGSDLRELFQ